MTTQVNEHLIGRVKWFNNKAGYGFITVTDGDRSGSDIFAHHSNVNVLNQQYKYLVQGEYVEFDLVKTDSGAHEYQSTNIHGINGGKLMCETIHEFKSQRNNYKNSKQTDSPKENLKQKQEGETTSESQPKDTVKPKDNVKPKNTVKPKDKSQTKEEGWTDVKTKKPRAPRAKKQTT